MKPAPFTYHRPHTVEAATSLLREHGDDAKILAGGQSLLPIMNMRLAEPAHLVDITAIGELRQHTETATGVRYGAATTHMHIEDGLVPDVTLGLLPHAAHGIGYRAIRNRGTIGGSLAHSDSSAEWPTVLSALDAVVHTASADGGRRIPVRELLRGFFTTALDPAELIVAVEVPRLPEGTRWGLYKMARKPGEFAESLAVALRHGDELQLWLGAARDVPIRLTGTENLIGDRAGGSPDLSVADLVETVGADTGADGHSRQLHAAAVHRALRATERQDSHV
ncbi:FAD binding domain-containing protein [Pseudonocardia spinosispora]|uniref:FAD binding domain-containing protein n=1 Tax=Pseudonocardia spinosispora TaxID=103441 RepID=UPI0003FD2F84|nr:FAD binding domain-containing protein [Pseudonocardia spinosispora]